MTTVSLLPSDLEQLKAFTPDWNFEDTERQQALLESGSRDFNAVPGSGKTSLLAAKLLLIAQKWPHPNKGLCVISHTTVARDQIALRLARTEEGSRLLNYPHFVGTIHAFVNQFLSLRVLPVLGLQVDVIDNDVFAARARKKLKGNRFYTLRVWLDHQANADALISTLTFKGPNLTVTSEEGGIPSESSQSGKQIRKIKLELAAEGVFRHSDMFAFAQAALEHYPELLDIVHRRFPMVFIDEMQDTSWEQESLLNRLFDGRSVMQRFGDVDQQIMMGDAERAKCTFPRTGFGTVCTSKRFGARIAAAATSVRLSSLVVTGDSTDDISPTLLLYKTQAVGQVIRRFGELVLDRLDDRALAGQMVRAMCTRKSVGGAGEAGMQLGDYWPAFAQQQVSHATAGGGFWRTIDAWPPSLPKASLAEHCSDVRRCLFAVLREAKAPVTASLRDGHGLARAIADLTGNSSTFQGILLDLVLGARHPGRDNDRSDLVEWLYGRVKLLLPPAMTLEAFAALGAFEVPEQPAPGESASSCTVSHAGRDVVIGLGTVASMKGQTHVASLLLESYGGKSKRFDLAMALPYIAGVGKNLAKLSDTQKVQLRNVYVAMTRPTHYLCLAANEARVAPDVIDAIEQRGWHIETLG